MDSEIATEQMKKHLMHCVRLINKAGNETIETIRKEPISNMKLIERASKCIKDPNPLSSTMANMSLKYPLSIDKEKALSSGLPTHFYHIGNSYKEDTHFHGRVLCKKEALEWWVNEAEVPDEETIEVINLLFKQHKHDVESYYNVNWSKVSIQWGTPNLERRRVSTRKPILDIDPSIRDQAIMQTLMPDFTTPYQRVAKSDLDKIRDLSKLTLAGKMSLSAQVRILLNQMDPRRRVLPVLAGSAELTTSLKHALTHTNFVITGYVTEEMREQPIVNRILESFGKNIHYEYVVNRITTEAVREILNTTTFLDKPIMQYLMESDIPETNYIKWMKVVIGRRITSESENQGLKTSPVPGRITIKTVENMSKVRFIIYEGLEVVNFKYGDIRGSFVHSGESILKITTNYTNFSELVEGITEIAVYCRWGMRATRSYSYNAMKNEIRNAIHLQPHAPLNCSPTELNALLSMNKPIGVAGALHIVASSEYKPCEFMSPYIDHHGNISSETTRQSIHFPTHNVLPKPIPDEIRCPDRRMIDHLSFKRLLKSKVSYYLEYCKELRRKVRLSAFDWENKVFVRYTKQNRILSKTCRDLLISMSDENWNDGVAAFYYCFCFQSPLEMRTIKYKHIIQGQTIDLRAKEGIFRYQEKEKAYFLYGVKLSRTPEIDYSAPIQSLLDGYKLSTNLERDLEIKSIRYLEDKKEEIPIGSRYLTYVSGRPYMVIRDPTIAYGKIQTVMRQVNAKQLWLAESYSVFDTRKRFLGEEDNEDETQSKRARTEEDNEDETLENIEDDVEPDTDTWTM